MVPLVSVIIPVYNVEAFLAQCIKSVVNQTYKNIEIIAINDGSTDNSYLILKMLSKKINNIKLINQENSGLSASRNKGLEEANGKYIYFLDSDDYILPDTIYNLIKKMEMYELDIIRFSAEPFVEDSTIEMLDENPYDFSEIFNEEKVYNKKEFMELSMKGYASSACLYIVKREVILNNALRFKEGILHEDELFTMQVLINIERAMYDPNFYYMRRYRHESIMTTNDEKRNRKSFDSFWIIIKELERMSININKNKEKKFLESRAKMLSVGLINKNVDEKYKIKKMKTISALNSKEKLFYLTKYRINKTLKKIKSFKK